MPHSLFFSRGGGVNNVILSHLWQIKLNICDKKLIGSKSSSQNWEPQLICDRKVKSRVRGLAMRGKLGSLLIMSCVLGFARETELMETSSQPVLSPPFRPQIKRCLEFILVWAKCRLEWGLPKSISSFCRHIALDWSILLFQMSLALLIKYK